jgi:chromosome segregation ATPase
MSLSAINIVLNAITSAFNKDVKDAANTMEKASTTMQQSANKAGQAIEQSLGSGQLRQKIASVTAEIDEQKQITREFMMELEKLRQKRDTMSKMDIQGQKRVRQEIEQTKAAIKDQTIAVSELTAKKQGFTQQLGITNQTLGGTRAALNGLATSFSSVSSIIAIVADDNKALRNTLMGLNAALNFSAAVMQVKDLQAQFGGLTKFLANPFVIATVAIGAAIAAIYAFSDGLDGVNEKVKEAQKQQSEYNKQIRDFATKIQELGESELETNKRRLEETQRMRKKYNANMTLLFDDLSRAESDEDKAAIRTKIQAITAQLTELEYLEKSYQKNIAGINKEADDKQAKLDAEAAKKQSQRRKTALAEIKKSAEEVKKVEGDLIEWLENKRFEGGEKAKKQAAEDAKQLTGKNLIAGTAIAPLLIQVKIDPKSYSQIVQDFDKLMTDMAMAVEKLAEDIAITLGETLGNALSGQGNGIEGFVQSVVGQLGNFVKTVGKMLIAYGISVEKFKLAFAQPGVAVAAGIAMVALGTAVANQMKQGPSVTAFANGGIVSGPTLGLMGEYPGARNNPEVIAPLDKLKTLMKPEQSSGYVAQTHISGRDLSIVLERYNKDSKRG